MKCFLFTLVFSSFFSTLCMDKYRSVIVCEQDNYTITGCRVVPSTESNTSKDISSCLIAEKENNLIGVYFDVERYSKVGFSDISYSNANILAYPIELQVFLQRGSDTVIHSIFFSEFLGKTAFMKMDDDHGGLVSHKYGTDTSEILITTPNSSRRNSD